MRFEKVSFKQFLKDCPSIKEFDEDAVFEIYNNISLPKRATAGSAGYDFYLPGPKGRKIFLRNKETVVIPTGIRAKMDPGWMLNLYPRSGLGFKYGVRLINTVGIIDSDYYYSENEGHIMVGLENGDISDLMLESGDRFVQGVFVRYGIVDSDDAVNVRDGGFGSTGK